MRLIQFLDTLIFPLLLLGVIWWGASKLTWDCTFLDEDEDASGAGLLGQLEEKGNEESISGMEGEISGPPERQRAGSAASSKRPHAPGLWVIYFSLAALPLFGIGQGLIPVENGAGRQWAFQLLWWYVAAAIGLLMLTSLLGLRRYLRQRHLTMPAAMAGRWVGMGSALALAILAGAILLPRPNPEFSLAGWVEGIGSAPRESSTRAVLRSDPGEGESETKIAGETERPGDVQGAEAENRTGPGGEEKGTGKGEANFPEARVSTEMIRWISWIFYGGLAVLAVWFLIWKWAAVREFFRELFGAFGKRSGAERAEPMVAKERAPRKFESFENPFSTGAAERMTREALILYSWEAMEAWARDAGVERTPATTPMELGRMIGIEFPEMREAVRGSTRIYLDMAYGGRVPAAEAVGVLGRLWRGMTGE